ncbi:MAG: thiamine phosphate synthase [Betaproteobacteria bacterium]
MNGLLLTRLHGLYPLSPDWDDDARLLAATAAVLGAGVRLLQYRHKTASAAIRRRQAAALRALTREYGALLLVNDDARLAADIGADGVHLGRDDGSVAAARALLPAGSLIGVSCYDDWGRAERAAADGADYVAFGSVFASSVKPDAVRAPLSLFARARAAGLHAVAIGGIDAGNIGLVAAAGAQAAALIGAVYDASDPGAAARRLSEEFQRGLAPHEP